MTTVHFQIMLLNAAPEGQFVSVHDGKHNTCPLKEDEDHDLIWRGTHRMDITQGPLTIKLCDEQDKIVHRTICRISPRVRR